MIVDFSPNKTGQGWAENGNLLVETNGNLIGTAAYGGDGQTGAGVVYEATPPTQERPHWQYQVIYRFPSGPGVATAPFNGLTQGKKGVIYGLTSEGGANGCGVAYQLTPPASGGGTWKETTLHTFGAGDGSDGCYPLNQKLLFDATSGSLFGTTEYGGVGYGTLFRLDPPSKSGGAWTETVLYAFSGGNDGAYPSGSIAGDPNGGSIFGTTQGGFSGSGVIWGYNTASGTMANSYDVLGGDVGTQPAGGVIGPFAYGDGNYYLLGTTSAQGNGSCNCGTVFALFLFSPGYGYGGGKILHTFQGTDGASPSANLALIGGSVWGTTGEGGLGWSATNGGGNGTLFKIQGSSPTTLAYVPQYSFEGGSSDGAVPATGLAGDSAGNVYGMTTYGGTNGVGTLFRFVP